MRATRLVVLILACVAVALLEPGKGIAAAAALFGAAIALNLVVALLCRLARLAYEPLTAVLDVIAASAVVHLSGGAGSPLLAVTVLPPMISAWVVAPRASAGVVALAAAGLLAAAPPTDGVAEIVAYAFAVSVMGAGAGICVAMVQCLESARPRISALADLPTTASEQSASLSDLAAVLGTLIRARHILLYRPAADGTLTLDAPPLDMPPDKLAVADDLARSGLVQSAVRARRPVLAAHMAEDSRLDASLTRRLGAASILVAPVYFREVLAGVIIALDRKAGGRFGDEDVAVVHVAVSTVVASRLAAETDPIGALLDGVREPLALVSPQGDVLRRNEGARQVLGEDLVLLGMLSDAAEAAAMSGRPGVYAHEDGASEWEIEAVPLGPGGRDGVLTRIVDPALDGDEGVRRLAQAVDLAVDAPLRAIRDYAAAIAHNLDADPATLRQFSAALLQHTAELSQGMDELLASALARLDPSDLHPEVCDLSGALSASAERVRALAGATPIILAPPSPPAPCSADPAVIGRALDAFLSASAAVSPEGIEVYAGPAEDGAAIEVRLAKAMPSRIRRRALRPFLAAGEARGLGIGIWLARHVARAHGGSLSISQDGRAIRMALPSVGGERGAGATAGGDWR